MIKSLRLWFLFLLIGAVSVTQDLSAQIILSQTDFGSVGDIVLYRVDTAYRGNVSTGSTGVNMTWNFNNLVPVGLNDTTRFLSPAIVPGTAQFPVCNLVIDEVGVQNFIKKDSLGLFLVALKLDVDTSLVNLGPIAVNPQLKIIGFPTTFNTITSSNATANTVIGVKDTVQFDSATSIYVDSASISLSINVIDTVNGWGALQIHNLTLPTLRQKTYLKITPAIQIKIRNPLWGPTFPANLLPQFIWVPLPVTLPISNLDNISVRYFATDKKYPVLEFTLDSLGLVTNTRFQAANSIIQFVEGQTSFRKINLFPNPVKDILHVNFAMDQDSKHLFTITDAGGKQVLNGEEAGKNFDINVSALPNGLYFLKIINQVSRLESRHKLSKE